MAVDLFASLVPIKRGSEKTLRAALEGLDSGAGSPFAVVPGTHVARLTVIQHVGAPAARHRRLQTALLSFSALVDKPVKDWLESLPAAFGVAGEKVWPQCIGWEPGFGPEDFARWLLRFRLPVHTDIIGHPNASVRDITAALHQRKQLMRLATLHKTLGADALRNAYNEAFDRWLAVPG